MKTNNKTPYEIRLDLLLLAQTILMAKHQTKLANVGGGNYIVETAPTTEEIIFEAEKMNKFISNVN